MSLKILHAFAILYSITLALCILLNNVDAAEGVNIAPFNLLKVPLEKKHQPFERLQLRNIAVSTILFYLEDLRRPID
jgi:hypothetical protein